ncbi:preprotein translocase subunit SecA [Campylobacter hominis]|uniref:Protein translocase subunit SecA n=1 Tax=Campylobacter hominis (strain ATCC BAA-381 / DSM 21671 / CCUG 45161 / LMG 19568 / NCTC 13146 / CH001A) TaxID=360107 RepID=SECA_CAMHC|nr:preprotein translocase subunit SecA [Campylobacter hominis]A7I1V8.1 RecName: Full=Protein translocase subunit SecA [Campylobacter hominis ATCC BAA-381]ABS50948.1 preprotein translocase, SecA subunit [Campylobacter hominis ATCC BAA-381]UAK86216.1 preprotein translocase subunit SecA [Campylobacter hominis]SUW85031.1 preprotein translocase subunit SecA [Campylobacter hominis]
MIQKALGKIFGTKNDRIVKAYAKRVAKINALEPTYEKLSDDELKDKFSKLKEQVLAQKLTLDDALYDVFAIVREASKRVLKMRHFDVQLIGGMVLHDGNIAEMKTGEGKTLVATLPVVLNAMNKKGVHVVTVNDYLAKRDAADMGVLYNFLGFSVGVILGGNYDDKARKEAYNCDITYGTNNEFGFDYLRDNMKFRKEDKVQRGHNFVIVDEVDSILIDEARTPLIISGPTNRTLDGYIKANEVAKQMKCGEPADPLDKNSKATGDFTLDEKNRAVMITEAGISKAEKLFGVDNLYSLDNAVLSHYLDQALKANYLFEKDVHYVVKDGQVVIVDEFTGRLSEGRRFSEGLHQALEAKEGVKIQEESQTLADITFQNYFRLYDKLSGMTGTAQTEATEFSQIYKLEVISIPTNLPVKRIDQNDLIYKTEKEKFDAVIAQIKYLHAKGQPVLVGTASIEKSEKLHELLTKEKINHSVLNAKNHEKEAQIIANAGDKGAVTIATNMAGRGVDIKINDEVRALGGLYILGTERHESRRIDNQLRGRSGRQGDPGESRFYLSLEDNLLRIFGSDKIKHIMERLGLKEGESIESRLVTKAVENAQKKVESLHFESRKYILEYDDVANEQRKVIYRYRNELLEADFDLHDKIISNREDYIANVLDRLEIFDGDSKENFDIQKITSIIKSETTEILDENKLSKAEDYKELKEEIIKELRDFYEEKMAPVDNEQRKSIEKMLYLQIVDRDWREHLYQMDILKTGIGLRGYNHRDPLTEYKKESYNLFVELVMRLKSDSIRTLHSIRFKTQEEIEAERRAIAELQAKLQEEEQKKLKMSGADKGGEDLEETKNVPYRAPKKIGRNEPCPCGSGKKYKDCHGKSGPKKGLFANND